MDSKQSPLDLDVVGRNSWVAGRSAGRAAGAVLVLCVLARLSAGTGMAVGTKSGARPRAARAVGVSGDWGHGWGGRAVAR